MEKWQHRAFADQVTTDGELRLAMIAMGKPLKLEKPRPRPVSRPILDYPHENSPSQTLMGGEPMFRTHRWAVITLAGFAFAGSLSAQTFISIAGNPGGGKGLANYSATLTHVALGTDVAMLVVDVTNTSSPGKGNYLTAVAFKNPYGHIATVDLASSTGTFNAIGGPSFVGGIKVPKFGDFDIGASTSDRFKGGGNSVAGLAPGESVTLVLMVTGEGVDFISAQDFPLGDGEFFLAGFGSSFVPGVVTGSGGGSGDGGAS